MSLSFQQVSWGAPWPRTCLYYGMNIWIILFALQVAGTAFALLRESGKDTQFEGDKLDFRS